MHNVEILDPVCQDELIREYLQSDILYTQLRDYKVFETTQPSKVFEYMSVGKPIIFAGKGEAVNLLKNAEAGLVIPPEEPQLLKQAILSLFRDNEKRIKFGNNGKQFVKVNHIREDIMDKLVRFVGETTR